ncbi:MAG: hypothetical protein AM326_01680 [Candidatus Thorarchaeota archaeon SMTZ-45]|nr:MAG: hypothetical protein AM326_01680 [Candidatus Thorarchaeota archaeon SMTZ-45]
MTTDLLLDSGAYSAKTQGKKLDIDDYIEYIRANEDVFDKYFNLDVIGDGDKSYQNYLYLRMKGLEPIPVWHAETSPEFLTHYLKMSEYIAIGAISVMSNERTIRSLDNIWREYLIDEKGYPVCKIHGFGLTSVLIMTRYPWYSVDSTSWVQFGRYGVVLIPKTRNGNWVYHENPHIVTVSAKSPRKGTPGKHFLTYPVEFQNKMLKYIESRGFTLDEVANNHLARDKINMLYYISVEQSMPEWPWKFTPKSRTKELI